MEVWKFWCPVTNSDIKHVIYIKYPHIKNSSEEQLTMCSAALVALKRA